MKYLRNTLLSLICVLSFSGICIAGNISGVIKTDTLDSISKRGAITNENVTFGGYINEKDYSGVIFVNKNGSNSNDGKSPNAAFLTVTAAAAASTSGDIIIVYPGTYAEANISLPAGVNVKGIDRENTIISTASANNSGIFILPANSTNSFDNITIDEISDVENGSYRSGIRIANNNTILNVNNCYLEGSWDGIYSHTTATNTIITVKNSTISSHYDGIGMYGSANNLYVYDTQFDINGSTNTTYVEKAISYGTVDATQYVYCKNCKMDITVDHSNGLAIAGVWAAGNSVTDLVDCDIKVTASNGSNNAYGVWVQSGDTTALYNCKIITSGGDTTNYDLIAFSGGIINLYGNNQASSWTVSSATIRTPSGVLGAEINVPNTIQTIVAETGITAAMINNFAVIRIVGNDAGVNITANPQIVDGVDGQFIELVGTNVTNTIQFDNGNGLRLTTSQFIVSNGDTLSLRYDALNDTWDEKHRSKIVNP